MGSKFMLQATRLNIKLIFISRDGGHYPIGVELGKFNANGAFFQRIAPSALKIPQWR